VSFTSETGAEFDGTGNYRAAAKALAATTAITISYIASDDDYLAGGTLDRVSAWGGTGTGGYIIYRSAAAAVTMTVYGSGGTKNLATTRGHGRGCMTWAVDLTNATNSRVHKNGVLMATADSSGGGSMAGTNNLAIGGAYAATYLSGGLSRFRIDYAVGADAAAQLANHNAFCGTYAAPLVSTHAAYADTSWTQSGASRCFATSTTTALCWPGGKAAYRWDGTVQRWAVEDSRTNRIAHNVVPACGAAWVCGGAAAIAVAVDPTGGKIAAAITLGGGTVDVAGTGYTALATVYPRVWVKCTGGALTIAHQGGVGSWTVDCTHASLNGSWAELHPTHAAVTVGAAWTATAAGVVTMRFSGLDATVYAPTVTSVNGYSVIPTDAAAGATGDVAFAIANATGVYWKTGDTVTQDVTTLTGTCWVTGATLYLSGAVGSECTGLVGGIEVVR